MYIPHVGQEVHAELSTSGGTKEFVPEHEGQWVIIMTGSNHHVKPIQMRPRMLYL